MNSCFFLLGALFGVAGLYVTLGADFIAATQLMVYVGGVVILMLFAVMLTGGKDFMEMAKTGLKHVPYMGNKATYIFGGLTVFVFLLSTFRIIQKMIAVNNSAILTPFENTAEKIGTLLITDHLLVFEMSSVVLLGALIGAAIIARPKKDI